MTVCPDCGNEFEMLGKHLTGPCDQNLERIELFDALVLGDGTIYNGGSGNHRLSITTTVEEYAEYLEDKLGWLHSNTVELEKEENRDIYNVRTICLPSITKQRERWYPNGKKRIPDDFKITPLTMKHWYCADGNLSNKENPRIRITAKNEHDRPNFLEELFPFDAVYSGYKICFLTKDTDEILSYMGDPPPGFEYKWD